MAASKVALARQLWRYFGPAWLIYRLGYAAQTRTGLLSRQLPAYDWPARPLRSWLRQGVPAEPEAYAAWRREHGGRFFFQALPTLTAKGESPDDLSARTEAEDALAGRWRYFSRVVYAVGFPPDWHRNPMTGQRLPAERHWSQTDEAGDIKLVWELSRFSIVYALVRAYAASGDERYPDAFWTLVEDWAQRNPPQRGPNWKCGQEAAFRLMAWCFGLYGFADSPHTTPERIASLAAMLAAHADRIAGNIVYARSQKNNHAISEAVGLWTVGLLFPEFARADRWRDQGRRVLVEETRRQVYADGAYVQHSANYHRLFLHDLLWALRLGEVNDAHLPDEVYERFSRATDFLYRLLDPASGQVPNYGANDGALILPLAECDYADFRPTLQAAHVLIHRTRLFPPGPWDELPHWLFGPGALPDVPCAPAPPTDLAAPEGGCHTLRGGQSWALIRCAHYRDRPAHADQLHVDLWWRGVNVACDAGTYLYSGAPPWNNGLAGTAVHNTVTVDGLDQMTPAGRFLWLDWSRGNVRHAARSDDGLLAYWEGEHDGYARLPDPVTHRRAVIRLGDETWLVLDLLRGQQAHACRLHWLLPDLPHTWDADAGSLALETPAGPYRAQVGSLQGKGALSLVRADKSGARGWHSPTYAHKEAALSLALVEQGDTCLFWTLFGPPTSSALYPSPPLGEREPSLIVYGQGWQAQVTLSHSAAAALVRTIRLSDVSEHLLELSE